MLITKKYYESLRLLDGWGNQSVLFQNLSSYDKNNVLAKFDKQLSASSISEEQFHTFQSTKDSKPLWIRAEFEKSPRGELITPLQYLSISYTSTSLKLAKYFTNYQFLSHLEYSIIIRR